jgi:hypothetical protein
MEQFERDELPKRWRKEQPDAWQNVWTGLLGGAAKTPVLNLANDVVRITRAVTTNEPGTTTREFVLVEARSDLSRTIHSLEQDQSFNKTTITGLPVWRKNDLAIGRVGPRTLAVGGVSEVDELMQVRLGLKSDLKIGGQLFGRFQALDQESGVRLISRDPPNLARIFHPVLTRELLDSAQLLGLSLTLNNPAKARLLMKLKKPEQSAELAQRLHNEPQRWLRLRDSDLLLYAQTPEVIRENQNLELRFNVPDNAALLLLDRLARTDVPVTAAQ